MFLFIIFLQFLGSLSTDPRAVQVNVKTLLVSHPNDVQKPSSVLNNIKALLRSLEKQFRVDEPIFRSQSVDGELTNFFLNLGEKFVNENDDYIRNFTIILANTLEDYFFRNKLTPLFGDDYALQAFVVNNSLNKWHVSSAQDIRANVQEALDTDDTIFHKMIQLADRFFNESDRKTLEDITTDLTEGNKARKDLAKAIKGTFNFIIIKKFKALDDATKKLIQNELKKLIYGYNDLDDNTERHIDSDVKVKGKKERVTEIPNIDKEYKHKNRRTIADKEEINKALKEINEDLERIKRRQLNATKTEVKSEEKTKREGKILLKQVEKEIKKISDK